MITSRLFKLDFDRVHFGDGGLGASTTTVKADTLFSALCHAALRIGGTRTLEQVVQAVQTGQLRFTDLLPFVGETYLVPKPIAPVERRTSSAETASLVKKQVKRISLVPVDDVATFLNGRADLAEIANKQSQIGTSATLERVSVRTGGDDAEPYRVGIFRFAPDSGLWVLANGSVAEIELFEYLLAATPALGGERTSGCGTFFYRAVAHPPAALSAVTAHPSVRSLLLTTALPDDVELDHALAGATYQLVRRGGFIASSSFAGTPRRKLDLYKIAAGSVFQQGFSGVVADVGIGGSHPVWSYSKPLFLPL